MSKRKGPKRPAQNDWHLWSEVTRTISPLSTGSAKKASMAPLKSELEELLKASAVPRKLAAPIKLPDPKNFGLARDGGRLFRNQPATNFDASRLNSANFGTGSAWSPAESAFTQTHQKEHPNQSIEPKMRRRVRRGRVPIDGRLDLHGMRQHEARSALHRFIATRASMGDRTLLVITGKGLKKTDPTNVFERGVLRHMLPRWLNEPDLAPLIAGYEVSAQHHGGEGAYYVRLKRLRE